MSFDVAVAHRLDVLCEVLGSDESVAAALGVASDQVAQWRQGGALDDEIFIRLIVLEATVQILSRILSPTSIPKWMAGTNSHIDNRSPLVALRQGDYPALFIAISALMSGAYA